MKGDTNSTHKSQVLNRPKNRVNSTTHDFSLFKLRGLSPVLSDLLFLMGKVMVWADSAYEALVKHYPNWQEKVQEKARRNHPLTDTQKRRNALDRKSVV